MAPTLYMFPESPPVRAVLITAKAIGLNLIEKQIDYVASDHLKPEYLKLNPQHTVPTLVDDDGFVVWESHAIITYLVSKYAKNDDIYPKDVKKRATIDQRLHFESGVVFAQLRRIGMPILREGKTTIDQRDRDGVIDIYGFLEAFLEGKQWISGDSISIADYSLLSSISSLNILIPIDEQKYPKVAVWLKKLENRPECEVNKKGVELFAAMFKSKLS